MATRFPRGSARSAATGWTPASITERPRRRTRLRRQARHRASCRARNMKRRPRHRPSQVSMRRHQRSLPERAEHGTERAPADPPTEHRRRLATEEPQESSAPAAAMSQTRQPCDEARNGRLAAAVYSLKQGGGGSWLRAPAIVQRSSRSAAAVPACSAFNWGSAGALAGAAGRRDAGGRRQSGPQVPDAKLHSQRSLGGESRGRAQAGARNLRQDACHRQQRNVQAHDVARQAGPCARPACLFGRACHLPRASRIQWSARPRRLKPSMAR